MHVHLHACISFYFRSLPSIVHNSAFQIGISSFHFVTNLVFSRTKLLDNNAGTSAECTAGHLRTPSCWTFANCARHQCMPSCVTFAWNLRSSPSCVHHLHVLSNQQQSRNRFRVQAMVNYRSFSKPNNWTIIFNPATFDGAPVLLTSSCVAGSIL